MVVSKLQQKLYSLVSTKDVLSRLPVLIIQSDLHMNINEGWLKGNVNK